MKSKRSQNQTTYEQLLHHVIWYVDHLVNQSVPDFRLLPKLSSREPCGNVLHYSATFQSASESNFRDGLLTNRDDTDQKRPRGHSYYGRFELVLESRDERIVSALHLNSVRAVDQILHDRTTR